MKIVGIGADVYDTLYSIPTYPAEDTKMRAASSKSAGGGPVATGLVAASKLGESASYIGVLSDDTGGVFLKADFEKYGKPAKIVKLFGGKVQYEQAVKELEENIYGIEVG